MKPYLSIIIPCYNEEQRIQKYFENFERFAKSAPYKVEVIFVNDGSSDKTAKVIEDILDKENSGLFRLVSFTRNHGKGYAVKRGIFAARGRFILFADADNATPIEQVDKLLTYANVYDVIIGSRYIQKGTVQKSESLVRVVGARFLNLAIRVMIGLKIVDTQCGFKLFEASAARDIFSRQTFEGFSFDVEILAIAKKLGYKIIEVPVTWIHDPNSKVEPIKEGFRFLKALIIIRWNFLTRKYHLYR